ncbi:MAG: aspartate aminotransferase family protein [Elusimicrobia bacterium]|nr:aspartate aminotransferase family protein [Elusimicrobiota bacterium]
MAKGAVLEKPNSKDALTDWTAEEVMELRQKHVLPSTLTYYTKPLMISRAEGAYLFDEKGKKYLDAFAGVVTISIGHCHPHWVKRIQDQIATFDHSTTLYLYPQLVEYAQKLVKMVKTANPALEVCFFTNSGCEANELAAILSKNYTGRSEFIALRHSFHGRTLMAMSFTGQSIWRHSTPYVFGVYHAPANYTYRRSEGNTAKQYAQWCAEEVGEIIKYSTSGKIAAYIAEPISGFGGVIDPEPEYFPKVYEIVKKHGGLFIADEVQTGVGRTGKKFLGIEQWGVRPDIVTMAKGIGNGYPLGAVVTTREIAESMRGKVHFNTFGGSPVAMAAGLAVLEVLEKEKLSQNAFEVGGYLKDKLSKMMEKQPLIGDVRGKGLMLGVELVKDRKTKEPAPQELLKVMDYAKEGGVLIGKGGMSQNIIRIKPPLCVTKKDADVIAEVLEDSFRRVK